jgi:hypothetical protein
MTDEQINAEIARECGWRITTPSFGVPPTQTAFSKLHGYDELPNYCADLNAMHDAEKVLTKDRNSYITELAILVSTDDLRGQDADWPWVCATARQRAEAFLRTLGKWEEGE